ncbi:hypothetical protein MRB53_031459 [Persea americana]|uniref:Uncharacterized protein n=1 Tax=Persea americana TaxID=3435 RepID=A0ACC2KPH7_PERAE|nr:hypothetical protein MRB53_031459 [Persea americana]
MVRQSILPEKKKLYLAMLALQFCYAGFHIVSRTALNMGVSKVVFPVYRNIIALLLLAPFAYILEKKERPPLTFSMLVQFFLLALCGITANQGFYLLGLYYASPTFASAIQNSVPAITFAMAAALRLEQVNIMRKDGLAKVSGTIASIGGATIITLYKGVPLSPSTTAGPVLRKYPARLSVTSFTCIFGMIQFLAIAAFVETDRDHWKIQSGGELLTILYAGLVASGISFSLQIWCVDRGGPLFVAVFQPVRTVHVAIMASLILGDQLYSGGIVGAILIMTGLYSVVWGKTEEKRVEDQEKEKTLTKHLLGENSQRESAAAADIP